MEELKKSLTLVKANDLVAGDEIVKSDKSFAKIKSIKFKGSYNTYDISIIKDRKNLFINEPNFILANNIVTHNSNLQIYNDAAKLVKKRRGIDIDWKEVDINEKFVYDNVVQNKDHFGVFQFESNFVRKMIDNILPENFDQLAAISALLRPGPLHMGMDKEFANRKNQRPDNDGHIWSPDDIPSPIRDILEPTMGILTYQEQIMQIANRIGGFTVGETNQFRKNLMKVSKVSGSDPEFKKKMDKYKEKFISSASQHLGSEKDAKEMWDLMESFAGYGFNLSHSVSYTYVSFREYWLKAHYDPEFNVALLNNTPLQKEKKGESIIAGYLTEMLKKSYSIERPNINESERSFTLRSDHEIVWGLNWVKNLTDKSIFDIIADRDLNGKFESIDDFYKRIGASVLNKRVLEGLVWSGALDDFMDDNLKNRYDIYNYIFTTLKKTSKFEPLKFDEEDIIDREIDYISISFQEMKNFATERKEWEDRTGNEIENLFRVEDEGSYSCIGIIDKVENKTTKNGKDYTRITLRDESKILNMVYAWPWKCKGWDSLRKGMLIQASLNNDGNFVHLVGWTLIKESTKQKEVEKKEIEEKNEEEKERVKEEEEKKEKFVSVFKSLYTKWNKDFEAKRNMDKTLNQPWLEISSKYETYKVLVYNFDEDRGIPRKDIIYMKDKFDAIYIINGEANLYDMMTFQSKMAKVKSKERKKFPSLETLGQTMSEDIITNKIS